MKCSITRPAESLGLSKFEPRRMALTVLHSYALLFPRSCILQGRNRPALGRWSVVTVVAKSSLRASRGRCRPACSSSGDARWPSEVQ